MKNLVFNAGSSSLRFELFGLLRLPPRRNPLNDTIKSLYRGHFDNHGKPIKDFGNAVKKALEELRKSGCLKNPAEIKAVGHRVVHGGEKYTRPALITPQVIAAIKKLSHLAPLHNPPNLACILACRKLFPGLPQVAVFDTAFHHTMPAKAYLYPLPEKFYKKYGIRRYGFHGTSHQYVFEQAQKKLGKMATQRTITCHLGNGCSITAIKDGKVIDTSMGFTPMEGVPMGTRSGDIDPSIIFYLMEKGMSAHKIKELLNEKSGILGISGISSDIRAVWAAQKKGNKKAQLAFEIFAYRIAKCVGGYATVLGGLDCLIFTGGIGENAFYLRKMIANYLKWLRIKHILVIPTNEELKIAEETLKITN